LPVGHSSTMRVMLTVPAPELVTVQEASISSAPNPPTDIRGQASSVADGGGDVWVGVGVGGFGVDVCVGTDVGRGLELAVGSADGNGLEPAVGVCPGGGDVELGDGVEDDDVNVPVPVGVWLRDRPSFSISLVGETVSDVDGEAKLAPSTWSPAGAPNP
jgi:hypothetical protein